MRYTAIYPCKPAIYLQQGESRGSVDWNRYEAVALSNTVTGLAAKEATEVRACWSAECFYVQFVCQDSYIVSEYRHRDDPLYEQDVVELFMDEAGEGLEYIELELSPNNVVFDARIRNDGQKSITDSDVEWDLTGLLTTVENDGKGNLVYEIRIPAQNFQNPPQAGRSWNVNFYRIDEDAQGNREYQAWSPTGEVNYHIPSRFGRLEFVDAT